MKKSTWIVAVGLILLSACTFTGSYVDRAADNEEGKVFLKNFYALVAAKNYKAVDDLSSDSLKQAVGPSGVSKIMTIINNKAGDYKSYKIVDHYTKSTVGTTNEIWYYYKLKVTYVKGDVNEEVGFKKENLATIKLYVYRARSDLF